MDTIQAYYPPGPINVSPEITNPSVAFKTEVKKVMSSILLFFIVYIIMIALSIALAVFCVYAGIIVITSVGHWLGILAGLGIISTGVLVFIFLIKFIFSVKKFDESGSIEIKEEDQPRLFSFIRQLTKDTQTPFPKKIILSPEVNASVFYNDSFWSMMFPVRKNLQIGLGLVNTLTISEFKAVMAHEFGHFSQRSMKLGIFVYNVNKAIYNMLFENKSFSSFLESWGNLHWAIGIFVWLTVQIITGIQKILQGMYSFINKNYLSLSREMEFHADAVSASVSGSNNLISSLRKLEISDNCYNVVLEKANEYLPNGDVFENVYANHHIVMNQYAEDFNLPLQLNVPVADEAFFKNFQTRRVNIKNQWASHPTREDREEHLNSLHVEATHENESAWMIFDNPDKLQKDITNILYRKAPDNLKVRSIPGIEFKERFLNNIVSNKLPEEYNGYYENQQLNEMDLDKVLTGSGEEQITKIEFEKLFSAEKIAMRKQLSSNEEDAQILQAIINKQIDVKNLDFDGEKYKKEEAPALLEKLNAEIEIQKKQIQVHEEKIVRFFFKAAEKTGAENILKEKYTTHFENQKKAALTFAIGREVINILSPLLHGHKVSIDKAREMASALRTESDNLKPLLQYWSAKGVFDSNESLKTTIERFRKADYFFFSDDRFFDTELKDIHSASIDSLDLINIYQFKGFKNLLEYQLEVYNKVA